MSVTLKQLAVFASVVQQRSFGAAAGQLRTRQSSVSHTLAALEKTVGKPLVTRSPPIRPTELGRALLPHARTVLAAVRSVEFVVSTHQTTPSSSRIVRIASPTACHRVVPRLLTLWAQAMPEVDIRIFEGDDDELAEWLHAGAVDGAILVGSTRSPGALVMVEFTPQAESDSYSQVPTTGCGTPT